MKGSRRSEIVWFLVLECDNRRNENLFRSSVRRNLCFSSVCAFVSTILLNCSKKFNWWSFANKEMGPQVSLSYIWKWGKSKLDAWGNLPSLEKAFYLSLHCGLETNPWRGLLWLSIKWLYRRVLLWNKHAPVSLGKPFLRLGRTALSASWTRCWPLMDLREEENWERLPRGEGTG